MRLHRHWMSLLGIGLALVLSGGNTSSTWAQGAGVDPGAPRRVAGVVFARGTLSVDVQDEDFGAMFRDIAWRAQIEISNLDGLSGRRISTRFTDLSLMEGLKRLLRVADVSGYAIMTTRAEDGVKIERILFLNANAGAGIEPRAVAPSRTASRRARRVATRSERARSRTTTRNPQAKENASTSVLEDLKANPETDRLLDQLVHPNEQTREQAIEGLMQLAGDAKWREMIEILEPYMNDLRHGDEETREEAREDLRSMILSR